MGFSYLTVIHNVGPYLPALLCLSAPRFTRLSLSYQSFLSVSLRLAIPSLAYRLALVKPRLTLWTVCVGRLRVELRSTAYQTVALTVMLPPIARSCSASCSKVLFHTGLLQGIAPIREFPCRHVHSQTHGRNTGTRTLSASPQTSRAHPLTLYSDCYMKS